MKKYLRPFFIYKTHFRFGFTKSNLFLEDQMKKIEQLGLDE